MFPFGHRHSWEIVTVRTGPWVRETASLTTAEMYWYWRCPCGKFLIHISGGERTEVTGRIPHELRDAGTWTLAEWLDRWLPKCKELEPRDQQ